MIRGIYTASSGMILRQLQQENLTNNIANLNTAGYKKDKLVVKAFKDYLIENTDKNLSGKAYPNKLGYVGFGAGVDETKTIFSQGTLEETDRNLDFAINGDGFFTVIDDKGQAKYTRDGRFSLDGKGNLVTSAGYKVLGIDKNNKQVPITVSDKNFSIAENGDLKSIKGNMKFLISQFNRQEDLIKDKENCYRATGIPTIMKNPSIKQSFYERSNIDPIEAITDMISIMRSYESSQKVLASMDETLGKTVNEVGAVR